MCCVLCVCVRWFLKGFRNGCLMATPFLGLLDLLSLSLLVFGQELKSHLQSCQETREAFVEIGKLQSGDLAVLKILCFPFSI